MLEDLKEKKELLVQQALLVRTVRRVNQELLALMEQMGILELMELEVKEDFGE